MVDKRQAINELSKRIAALSPEKRAIFERQLKQKNLPLLKQAIPKRKDLNALPLSYAQERLWFLHQLEPDRPVYNIPFAWHFQGKLNIATLKRSLDEIIYRHEALRTTFVAVEGEPTQAIASSKTVSLALPIIDLQQLSEQQRETEAQRLAIEEAKRPFNLEKGLLLRVTLLQLNAEESVLIVILHHIIADGWSRGLLLKELTALYKALDQNKPSPLPQLPIQYADFAVWQRQWLETEEANVQLDYWREQLNHLPILNLPTDRPRPIEQTHKGATQSFTLAKTLIEALKALSRQEGVTLYMTLLTAFKILLHRYSSQVDLAVGSPTANRNWAETEGLIGFFVNTLVLRTDLSGNPTFQALLRRVQKVTANAYQHQDLPFAKVVEELQPERNLGHNPLFQVMFQLQNEAYQFQNALTPDLEIPGLSLRQFWIDPESTKFDLTWHLVERTEGILAVVEYSTDLFDSETIARMLRHFEVLLQRIVTQPQAKLSQLPILIEAERYQLLTEWNTTQAEHPSNKCTHQLFEAQVERTPHDVAVVFKEQNLTYSELNQKANQLAHYLKDLGVGAEKLVGICVERSPLMVIGILGILKAGGAYVPLDPIYPQERLAFMLEDARVPVLLTQETLTAKFSKYQSRLVCLDKDWSSIEQEKEGNLTGSVTGKNLAYVIYTSGSTGKPKGTAIAHEGLVNYLNWAIKEYKVADGCGSLVQSSIGFDATITSLFSPLLVGKKVVLLPEEEIEALAEALSSDDRFSFVKLTPAHLEILNELLLDRETIDRTDALIIGGEALLGKSLSFWRDRAPDTRLINEYGPTETVVGCCIYEVPADAPLWGTVPIGRAIANTQLYILDRYLEPVPVGVPGELYIGGAGVARGYLNQPELTAEKFVPNPFGNSDRLYKTGDLARYLPDGNIEYLGRLDHQVKIRGFRIELGEIEATLAQHPEIQKALVICQENQSGIKQLIAYVVVKEVEENQLSEKLRYFLREKLPDYMVPATFVRLSSFPLTANGKIDRKSLPTTDWFAKERISSPYVPPRRTPNEKILAAIWAEVLGKESISSQDNFFEIGGDSILSMQIVARANRAGLQISPKQIFQYQTIAELAAIASTAPLVQAEQGLVTGSLPLTPIQHWFFAQNLPHPDHYNQAVLLAVVPELKPSLLEKAVEELLVHHDALRLRFVQDDTGWQQFTAAPDEEVPFSFIDLSALTESESVAAMETAANHLQTRLNLSTGPIIRVALFHLGATGDRLSLIAHHLAVDGISWRILIEDLFIAYQQLERGEAVQLSPKTHSYQDWAQRLEAYGQTEAVSIELDYWLNSVRQGVSLPVDYPAGKENNTVASAALISMNLSNEQTRALIAAVPQAYHTQVNDLLLTALVQSFARWTGSPSLLVDLESHGREALFEDINLSRTVGWFTAIFPVLLQLEQSDRSGEVLKSIKEQLRRIPKHGINYGILRYLSRDKAIGLQLENLPQAEVVFNYLGQLDRMGSTWVVGLAQESSGAVRSPKGNRRYLLEINGFVREDRLHLNWTYSKNIHQQTTIERLAQSFKEALQTLIVHCQSPETGGYTPSDFSAAKLSQKQLDQFIAKIKQPGRR